MKERIKQLLESESISPADFAQKLGVQRSSISHVLSGRNNPSLDFLQKILLAFPAISPDWLLLGKGQISRAETYTSADNPAQPMIQKRESIDLGINELSDENDPVYNLKTEPEKGNEARAEKIIVLYDDGSFEIYKGSI